MSDVSARVKRGPPIWSASDVAGAYFRLRPDFGALCESAEPAAVFDERLVRPSRKTLDAADAARADVLRLLGMWSLPSRAGATDWGRGRPGLKLRLESHPRLLVAS